MITIKPFPGLRPAPQWAEKVPSPPYDVLSSGEARNLATANPASFLHINKPEIDLPPATDPYSEEVYFAGKRNLERFRKNGWLIQDPEPAVYIYRLTWRGHSQSGWFCLSAVDDYDEGRIRRHELTRKRKEEDRTRLMQVLNAQVGPVFLLYKSRAELASLLQEYSRDEAVVDFTAEDGVRHQLWMITGDAELKRIENGFARVPCTYVADGHHRSAAASNLRRIRRAKARQWSGEEPENYFLSVIFPHDQLHILPYNRVVRDLGGLSPEDFLDLVSARFQMERTTAPPRPQNPGEFAMFVSDRWFRLRSRNLPAPDPDFTATLDVEILRKQLLEPILEIGDPRTDPRLDFVGGIRGNAELERLVNNGEFQVAFALRPTSVETLLAVADAGLIMPPKPTWFEPKLRSGLVSYLLE